MNVSTLSSQKASTSPPADPKAFEALPIGGMTPCASIDFPGKLAAVVFTQGCPWRCRYCHNAELWDPEDTCRRIPPEKLYNFFLERRGFLEGVVVSGGEPTLHPGLKAFLEGLRGLGYATALHTNGMNPRSLAEVIGLLDWVAMDVKAPVRLYPVLTGVRESGARIEESARIILESGIAYEFRTTYHPAVLTEADLEETALALAGLGARSYVVQSFSAQGCRDGELAVLPPGKAGISEALQRKLKTLFPAFFVRSS